MNAFKFNTLNILKCCTKTAAAPPPRPAIHNAQFSLHLLHFLVFLHHYTCFVSPCRAFKPTDRTRRAIKILHNESNIHILFIELFSGYNKIQAKTNSNRLSAEERFLSMHSCSDELNQIKALLPSVQCNWAVEKFVFESIQGFTLDLWMMIAFLCAHSNKMCY